MTDNNLNGLLNEVLEMYPKAYINFECIFTSNEENLMCLEKWKDYYMLKVYEDHEEVEICRSKSKDKIIDVLRAIKSTDED